jgi:hypothetical protein
LGNLLKNLALFTALYRYLTIAKSSEPPIVRFDVITSEIQTIDFDGSAQVLSVDQDNDVVYWDNFDGATEKHNLTRTYWETDLTEALNISYDGDIDLAQDYMYLYVLDKENNKIDKYHKRTWVKVDSFSTVNGPLEIFVAFGKQLQDILKSNFRNDVYELVRCVMVYVITSKKNVIVEQSY